MYNNLGMFGGGYAPQSQNMFEPAPGSNGYPQGYPQQQFGFGPQYPAMQMGGAWFNPQQGGGVGYTPKLTGDGSDGSDGTGGGGSTGSGGNTNTTPPYVQDHAITDATDRNWNTPWQDPQFLQTYGNYKAQFPNQSTQIGAAMYSNVMPRQFTPNWGVQNLPGRLSGAGYLNGGNMGNYGSQFAKWGQRALGNPYPVNGYDINRSLQTPPMGSSGNYNPYLNNQNGGRAWGSIGGAGNPYTGNAQPGFAGNGQMSQQSQPFMPGNSALGSSQQSMQGIRAQPQDTMGISGLPYQRESGIPQSRAGGFGMNAGGNMMAQSPADSRGMGRQESYQSPNAGTNMQLQAMNSGGQMLPQQASPVAQQAVPKAGPAPFTPGWINPMFSQSNDAFAPQNAPQQSPQGMGVASKVGAPPNDGTGNYRDQNGQYYFESAPSTLDPGSMAGLQAWLGGSNSPYGPNLAQQQQGYLNDYRRQYPNGVPGVNNYITPTTNYLTNTR